MSSIGSPNPFLIAGKKTYEIQRSLRFNDEDNTYLSRTPSSAGNRRTWTISIWFKTESGADLQSQRFWSVHDSLVDGLYASLAYENDGFIAELRNQLDIRTTGRFRDPTAWYHVVLALDTTQSTASDRVKLYVNGTQVTDFGTASYPSQNHEGGWNSTAEHNIGRELYNTRRYFSGYMTEFNNVDGLQLTPSSFGETDAITGQWIPKKYTGSYGTNGFYLNFSDNSGTTATTLGKDSSGNGNNFTPNNFSVSAGEGNDSLEDTPTLNYPTLNPLDMGATSTSHLVFTNGNLQVKAASGVWASTRGTFHVATGKWYWEVKVLSAADLRPFIGIIESEVRLASNQTETSNELGPTSTGIAYWVASPLIRGGTNTSGTSTNVPSCTAGDIVGVALDMDNKKVFFSKNGTFFASQDPANSSGEIVAFSTSMQSATIAPAIQTYNGTSEVAMNFGQRAFDYTPPTGYKKLNSANLSDPTIKKPTDYFDTLLYTGQNTSSLYNVTGLDFQPDWVWGKARNDSIGHILFDAVRGEDKQLETDNTNAEVVRSSAAYRFLSNGFAVSTVGNLNNPVNYVAWNWNAGGSTVTNNDGTIASQVRASTTAGFSIVGYTGNGSNSQTVGHGLGVSPDLVILKDRDSNSITGRWTVLHSYDTSKNLELDTEGAAFGHQSRGSITGVSNSTFTLFGSTDTLTVNESGDDYIAYVFSGVSGYSSFGTYTGNGSTNGPFIFTGFKPAFVIIRATGTGKWTIFDNKRNPENPVNKRLKAESSGSEDASYRIFSFLANGMKLEDQLDGEWNGNGTTFIYLAFAESPFKYARAR